jgi:hypothetical protein
MSRRKSRIPVFIQKKMKKNNSPQVCKYMQTDATNGIVVYSFLA